MSDLNTVVATRAKGKLNFEAEVRVEPFDFGNFLGVAVILDDRRHAVRVKIEDSDLTAAAELAAEALNDWHSDNG
jgi:hypothetical protein